MPPPNTLLSVGKCSGLGLAWSARHGWIRFLSGTSPLSKCNAKPPCIKNSKPRLCVKKESRIYALDFLRLYLLLPSGIDNQIDENDVIKTKIVEVIRNAKRNPRIFTRMLTQNNENLKNRPTAVSLVFEI